MAARVRVTHAVELPDPVRVARYHRTPELGPKVLFFSGGSALRDLSRALKYYTHHSIHLITPFDSGGSSARLRDAFSMLSVGDLRNRLMALADETVQGNPEIYRLFSYRFALDARPAELSRRLEAMIAGEDELVADIPAQLRRIIRTHLRVFAEQMPSGFDLRGASIGNLVLAGGYLNNDRDIDSVIFLFSKLIAARGIVRPVADADLHLDATLVDGTRLVGQHRLTGKVEPPIGSAVRELTLATALESPEPGHVVVDDAVAQLITGAEVICYPMGSFYSSVVANLLPEGVGRAIVKATCPKVYVANMGVDPEQRDVSLADAVAVLLRSVRRDAGEEVEARSILDFVLVDSRGGNYDAVLDVEAVRALGVEVVDLDLTADHTAGVADPVKLSRILVSLA